MTLPKMGVKLGHTNRLLTVGERGDQELLSKERNKDSGIVDESLPSDPVERFPKCIIIPCGHSSSQHSVVECV